MQDPRCKGLFVTGGSQAPAAATQNLVELSCCKLKKIYVLCENFIYTGQRPVPLDQHLSLRLASRWASMILLGSASALLVGRASYWVGMGSGESALSGLSELSFMILFFLWRQ